MPPYAIARFLYEKETYALINLVGSDKRVKQGHNKFMLAKYQTDGDDEGIWCGGNTWRDIPDFQTDCQRYSVMVTSSECAQVFMCLYGFCNANSERKRARTIDKNLSAFANGVFDWEKKLSWTSHPNTFFCQNLQYPCGLQVVSHTLQSQQARIGLLISGWTASARMTR